MIRFSCLAHGPSVIDEKIRKAPPLVLGKKFLEIHFYLVGILVLSEPQSDGKPFDMGIHHHTGDIKDRP